MTEEAFNEQQQLQEFLAFIRFGNGIWLTYILFRLYRASFQQYPLHA